MHSRGAEIRICLFAQEPLLPPWLPVPYSQSGRVTDPGMGSVPRDKDRVPTSTRPWRHCQPLLLPELTEKQPGGTLLAQGHFGSWEASNSGGLHMPCVFLQAQVGWASRKGPLNSCLQVFDASTMPRVGKRLLGSGTTARAAVTVPGAPVHCA